MVCTILPIRNDLATIVARYLEFFDHDLFNKIYENDVCEYYKFDETKWYHE
jgi:hypothetical protein